MSKNTFASNKAFWSQIINLQHLYRQTARRQMGQSSSKTYYNQEMQQLKQLYSPLCKLSQLPGQPLCIQYVSPLQKKINSQGIRPLQPFLELYSLQLNASQKEIIKDTQIYDQRRHNLPWIVKVICYDVQKKHCECSSFSYKYTVCTERVEFRLNSFKIKGKDSKEISNSYKYLQSLSFEQAVYVLINTLQGLQILNQQFKITYPTAKSIGITRLGQVKVWINENWAINNQSSLVIPQRLIIQESLKLFAQRTKGNLLKMLAIENNYQNLTFHQIQSILSQFVIAFNNGKKMLIQRLNQESNRLLDDSTKMRKYSLKKEKKTDGNQIQIFNTPLKSNNQNLSTKRQFYSNRSRNEKSNSIRLVNQNYQTPESSGRNRALSQPKKQITFSYTQPQSSTIQTSQKQSSPIQIIFPQPISNIRGVPIKSEPLINPSIKMEHKNYSFSHFQRAIQRKISQNTKTITITTVNSNQQSKKQQVTKKPIQFARNSFTCNRSILQISKCQILNNKILERKQPFTAVDSNKTVKIQKIPKTVCYVTPESILAQGEVLITQQRSEEAIPYKGESINSITEQFRQLLQSDKKIQSQYDFSDDGELFEISLMSLQKSEKRIAQDDENALFYQKSESEIDIGRPLQRNCYSIKEVDEELSYQLQSTFNK